MTDCPTGLYQYGTPRKARKAAQKRAAEQHGNVLFEPVPCERCGLWHVRVKR